MHLFTPLLEVGLTCMRAWLSVHINQNNSYRYKNWYGTPTRIFTYTMGIFLICTIEQARTREGYHQIQPEQHQIHCITDLP